MQRLKRFLFEPVDISSLVWFRICFGAILLWEVFRFFNRDVIRRYWIEPEFLFTYQGFSWVKPWPGEGMHLHVAAMGVLAAFILLGLFYRLSAILLFVGFTYLFLLDKTNYLNHFYLISLISFLMIVVPANGSFSLDALMVPRRRRDTVPRWCIALIAFQLSMPYVFGGIAKMNQDWIDGWPMRMWLARSTDFPVIGQYFTKEWMVQAFCWGGMFFDLFIVPLLLWRRTRWLAVMLILAFHLANDRLFHIGIFPWFMLAATGVFFPPDWFRNLLNRICPIKWRAAPDAAGPIAPCRAKVTLALLALWAIAQIAIPLRHYAIPGNVHWTEEGHRFAWHMMLLVKRGETRFALTNLDTGRQWMVDPERHLTPRQCFKLATHPDMILQFAHFLAARAKEQGHQRVAVHALTRVSMNGREPQPYIDPEVDLAAIPRYRTPADWILPFDGHRPRIEWRGEAEGSE